jgi:hypothetical protein
LYFLRRIVNTICSSREQTACFKATEVPYPLVPRTYQSAVGCSWLHYAASSRPSSLASAPSHLSAHDGGGGVLRNVTICPKLARLFADILYQHCFILPLKIYIYIKQNLKSCPLNNLKISNVLKVSNNLFKPKNVHKYTWEERGTK